MNTFKRTKNPYQPFDFKNLKKKICKPKVSMRNVCDFQKENHTCMDLKIYRKSIA
jgi:hypothetical protein